MAYSVRFSASASVLFWVDFPEYSIVNGIGGYFQAIFSPAPANLSWSLLTSDRRHGVHHGS